MPHSVGLIIVPNKRPTHSNSTNGYVLKYENCAITESAAVFTGFIYHRSSDITKIKPPCYFGTCQSNIIICIPCICKHAKNQKCFVC